MVSVDEVPQAWGLMELTRAGLRVKKQAPARSDPAPLDRGFAASLLRAGEDLTEAHISGIVSDRVASDLAAAVCRVEEKFNRSIAHEKGRADKALAWIAEFETAFGMRPNMYLGPENMAARITMAAIMEKGDFMELRAKTDGLLRVINTMFDETE